jgi:oxazoline/thiazoline dehydrogenase
MFEVSLNNDLTPTSRQRFVDYFQPDWLGDVCAQVVTLLNCGPLPFQELEKRLSERSDRLQTFFLHGLNLLVQAGIVELSVVFDHRTLAVIRGTLPILFPARKLDIFALSRFASIRSSNNGLLVETPFCAATVTLMSDEAGIICSRLARGVRREEFNSQSVMALDEATSNEVFLALDAIGAICDTSVPEQDSLVQWEHHDAIFHALTRGRSHCRRGGTYRFLDQRPPAPAIPQRTFGHSIPLPDVPTVGRLRDLEALFEARHSVRSYGDVPITLGQLGLFIRQVARVRAVGLADARSGYYYESISRAYPSGGACHELEYYPVVHRCNDLARGVYYYDSFADRLHLVQAPTVASDRLLQRAAQSMGTKEPPDIVVCIAARFSRVNWKYEGVAYSLVLKNVGVALQTMYLVATAMGLAPCAIGAGDSDDFIEATGNTMFKEESVGEFALGSAPNSQ